MSVIILPIMTAFIIQAFNNRIQLTKIAKQKVEASNQWKLRSERKRKSVSSPNDEEITSMSGIALAIGNIIILMHLL
jgi:hypothetical protein